MEVTIKKVVISSSVEVMKDIEIKEEGLYGRQSILQLYRKGFLWCGCGKIRSLSELCNFEGGIGISKKNGESEYDKR